MNPDNETAFDVGEIADVGDVGGSPIEPGEIAAPSEPVKPDKDDFDSLLDEFDRTTAKEPKPQEAEKPQEHKSEFVTPEKLLAMELEQGKQRALTENLLAAYQREQADKLEKADFEAVLKDAESYLDGKNLPDGYAKRWLLSEYVTNKELSDAWANRYTSEQAMRRAYSVVKRTLKRLGSERVPDPESTADREAVTAAIRGASTKMPEPKPRDYSRMSNAEYQNSIRDEYGFTPQL